MLNRLSIAFSLSVVFAPVLAGAETAGDPVKGEQLFRQCAACHMVGKDAVNRVGPQLNALFGRTAGTAEGARYSDAMVKAGEDGLVWTEETVSAYVENPRAYVRGSRMSYRGMPDAQDRADLITYLHTFADGAQEAMVAIGFEVSEEILAIAGDPAYGEYLSSECTACHQASGGDSGIPSITGWATADFVTAMHAYKEGAREHNVMQMMAGRLSSEEIAGLAAYFEGLE